MSQQLSLLGNDENGGATFDATRQYRYRLWRVWDLKRPTCAFVMLNPSTADEHVLDPTLRRCVDFARRWGCGRLEVGNIFAWRSTDPAELYKVTDPIGDKNDAFLQGIMRGARIVVAAWGKHGDHMQRGGHVFAMAQSMGIKLKCLGTNEDLSPKHPLYIAAETPLQELRGLIV